MPNILESNVVDGRNNYIRQWLDAGPSGPVANNAAPAGDEDDQGFAGRLYHLCLSALQDFYRQQRDQPSSESRLNVLRECLGRLYLWGEPFGIGELDKALRQSDELRDMVLERLTHVGKLVLRSKSFSCRTGPCSHP